MAAPQNVIALVFDFDDTLTDDSTTALLDSVGIDTKDFWGAKAKALLDAGWDPTPAYLKLLLDHVGDGKPFGKLTNARLREFGGTLKFYPGLPGLFKDLRDSVSELSHLETRSSSSTWSVAGWRKSSVAARIAKHLAGIWACEFAEEDGEVRHLKNIVSFAERTTKYLFQINKGIGENAAPYAVNERVDPPARRVPFE